MNNKLQRLHTSILLILGVNFLTSMVCGVGLQSKITTILVLGLISTGIVLFYTYAKPFKRRSYYYSIYVFWVVMLGVGWLLRGIVGAILFSVVSYPLFPDTTCYENQQWKVVEPFSGVMGACCNYQLKEKIGFFLEKNSAKFRVEVPIIIKDVFLQTATSEYLVEYELPDGSRAVKKLTVQQAEYNQ